MSIRGLLFDLGNVLIDYRPEIFIRRLAERSQIPERKLTDYFLSSSADIAYTEGKISSEEFFRAVSRDLGFRFHQEEFREIWCDIFFEKRPMESLIERLKKSYPVWILSNTNAWHFEFLKERFPILHFADRLFLSYELKCQKPDDRIFNHVIRETGFLPQEIYFTDDLEMNIQSARRLGFYASQFRSPALLAQELEAAGILENHQ